MAHGWDSYFDNLPTLASDPSTLRSASESEESLSQHIENFTGHHDFADTMASHEAPAADSNFNTNYYSNASIENSSSDCVYQRYYKDTPWQPDGEQMEKDYLPRCGNGDIDFASDGLSTSELPADLQGLKQDCGMLGASFLEDYSDVSSCSDADLGDTRPSCKFMASNSKPKPDISIKHSTSEWLFTHTENVTFPTDSLCPNLSDANVILNPSNVKAGDNVECVQNKMESPENAVEYHTGHNQSSKTSNVETTTGRDTAEDWNHFDGCEDQKQKDTMERDLTQGEHLNISLSGHENLIRDGIENYPDGNVKEQSTATAANMTATDNEQDHLDEKVHRKAKKRSLDRGSEGLDNPKSTESQDRNREDEQEKHKEEIKELGSLENGNSEKQKSPNPNNSDGQDESMENDCREKEMQSNISRASEPLCFNDASEENEQSAAGLSESCLELNGSNTNLNVAVDPRDQTKETIASHVESCMLSQKSSRNINPCLKKGATSPPEKKSKKISPTDADCRGSLVTNDHKEPSDSNNLDLCLQSNTSCTDRSPRLEKEITSQEENTNTNSSDQQQNAIALQVSSLCGDLSESTRGSFEELGTLTVESSAQSMLYGEPLSREDSSCDTDEAKLDTSQHQDSFLARSNSNSMDHSEDQTSKVKSFIQTRKNLQPVVILKSLDAINGMNNSYHCAVCQHTTHTLNDLIEHHHHCHSMDKIQFCETCKHYLLSDEQAEKHLCGATKEKPPDSGSQKKSSHGRHKCIKCGLVFSKLYQHVKHMRTHTGKTPFRCGGCRMYFAQSGTLQRHKSIPGRCKKLKPPDANSDPVISKPQALPQKELVQKEPDVQLSKCYVKLINIYKTNVCHVCGKAFLTANEAKKHFDNFHKGKNLVASPSQSATKLSDDESQKVEADTRGKHKCPICPRFFKYSYNRARHLRYCVKDAVCGGKNKVNGKYQCPLCHANFTLPSNRYRHINTVCIRECVNRLAKEKIKPKQKTDQKRTKETEQKTQFKGNEQTAMSRENEQKKHAPLSLTDPKAIPRYKCNLCPAVFCHASGKYRHMKKHELFKLTGKMFKYRKSVFSFLSNPANLTTTMSEESKDGSILSEADNSNALSCFFCGKCFSTSQSLKKHQYSHKGEKPYRCLECGKAFKKRTYLLGHRIVHQRRIQCTVCKKILPSVRDLIQHRNSHLKRGMLQCPDCHLQFQYPAHLLRHLMTHKNRAIKASQLEERPQMKPQQSLENVIEDSEPKQRQCSLCKELFDDAQVLRKHCLTHISGSLSNQCPFCKHNFSNRRYLLRHMIKHTGDKPFSCNNCGKQFYRDIYLRLHSAQCLPAQIKRLVTMEMKPKGSHKCLFCPRVFTKKNRLKNHHHGHKMNTLLLCSRCGQYFGFTKLNHHQKNCVGTQLNTVVSPPKDDLSTSTSEMSQNVHKVASQTGATKVLQLKCSHCSQRFRYRSLLLRHLVSHTGVQPYACVHCGHRFGSRSMCLQHEAFCDGVYKESNVKSNLAKQLSNMPSLREMTQKHHAGGDAEYKCKFCTKTFMKPRNLRRHILTHNEVKPYRCKACDSCFSRYDHLKVHQTRCKGRRSRLEVCIPKISLDDVGTGWQNKFGIQPTEKPESFECKPCSRSFSTQSRLSRHNTMFHTMKLFKCAGCGSSFSHEKSLKKHRKMKKCKMASHETDASSPVGSNPPTDNVTKPLDVVRNRILQKIQPHFNKKYKYVCSYCPRAFGNSYQLNIHTRLHTGERPYVCEYCGMRFIRKDYVQRHFIKCTKKTQQNNVLCDRCGGFFPRAKLENHKKMCTTSSSSQSTVGQNQLPAAPSPPKGFSCAYCSSRFLLFSQLQEHFLSAHKMETMVPPVSTAPLQHHLSNIPKIKEEPMDQSCDDQRIDGANLICKLDSALAREVPTQFSCPECKLSFMNKAGLSGHMRTHTKDPPFHCKSCKKGFWNKSLLRNHYRKCRFGYISKGNAVQPLKAEFDFALNESVLMFPEGSKTTGTEVLQTNFSSKEDVMDESPLGSEENEAQGSSSKKTKAVQYQCSECDKSFTDGLMLISHLEDHGREEQERKRNTCSKCGRVCSSQGNLEKHMRMHGISKAYSCPSCSQTFYTSTELEVHRTCHDLNRPYACKLCNQRFWTRPSLCNHYSEDHPDDVFTCRFCHKSYSVKKSLTRHYKKWHQKEQRECGSVTQEKRSTDKQSSSQVSTNGDSDEDENNSTEDSDSDSAPYFPCHVCGKTFPTSESLEDHQRCHLGEKPHECEECGKCFFQASQLQQHQRMHKSEFQCQACGRGFVSLFALRKHKHTHGKSRPYRCSKCHLSFTGPTQLAEHMSTHREENFPCDICNRVFLSKSSRAEHRKSHSRFGDHRTHSLSRDGHQKPASQDLRYRCGVCSERFRDPEKLSEHGCVAAKERPYSCSDCDKHFLHASHLNKHRTTHQLALSGSEYPCNQCNNKFSSSQQFLAHLKGHVDSAAEIKCKTEDEDGFKCPVCHQCFISATELMSHFPIHSGNTFDCKICKMTLPSRSKLEEHERCHLTSATEFECIQCGQSFLGRDAFHQHICSHQLHAIQENEYSKTSAKTSPQTYHQVPGEEEEVDVTGEDLYNCSICSKLFSSKSSLLEHQNKNHQNEKPFSCQYCGKAFSLRRYLKEHERRHQLRAAPQNTAQSGEANLKCTQCHAVFDTAVELSLHMRFHAEKNIGQFRCDMCNKSFSQWSLLKQHQESHVGQVVYECNECDKAFAFPHLLEEHQQTHSGSSH